MAGYAPAGRLATTLDEIAIEAQVAAEAYDRDVMRRAFAEICRLARKGGELLAASTKPGAPGALASA